MGNGTSAARTSPTQLVLSSSHIHFSNSVCIFPTRLVLPSSRIHFYQLRADFSNSARTSIISHTFLSAPCGFFQLSSYFHHLTYIFINSVRIFPTRLVLPSSHIHFYQLRADFSNSARISIISPTFPPIPCISILAHTFANSRKFRGYRTKLQKSNIIFFNKTCFFPSNTV